MLGLDVGGSSVKCWAADPGGDEVGASVVPLPTLRPAPHRAEFDPATWWSACLDAVQQTSRQLPSGTTYAGLVVSSLRQGFVLLDGHGTELGPGVLNSDRRGASALPVVRATPGLYELTGHWPAPELTLPKLLHLKAEEPDRWAAARRLLFVHDWLVHRLTGVQVTEVSYACAGQLADVAARTWAVDLLGGLGIPRSLLADLVEPGTRVGTLRPGVLTGLPTGVPVVAGCGDTQLAAAGAAGLADGAICIVAGSSTPVLASTAAPLADPEHRPWVSTHLTRDRWAAETNAGYPGAAVSWWAGVTGCTPADVWQSAGRSRPGAGGVTAVFGAPRWDEESWTVKAPPSLVGLSATTTADDIARALVEAHAITVASQIHDLEQALGGRAGSVTVTGGGATGPASWLPELLADVLGRPVLRPDPGTGTTAAARAAVSLVTGLPLTKGQLSAVDGFGADYQDTRERWHRTHDALRAGCPEEVG